MSGGFKNKPKILRGAFVELGLSLPPLVVVFQFNPLQLTRNRSISYAPPNDKFICPPCPEEEEPRKVTKWNNNLTEYHKNTDDIFEIRDNQRVSIDEESINLELRFDATEDFSSGDSIAVRFGILPRLATLEMMVYPKGEGLLGKALRSQGGFSFTKGENPPMILFIWGHSRVLPVNINSMNITETEFNTLLYPIRAIVSVSLTVIEGKNIPYTYSKAAKEAMAVLNLANITEVANVTIPG